MTIPEYPRLNCVGQCWDRPILLVRRNCYELLLHFWVFARVGKPDHEETSPFQICVTGIRQLPLIFIQFWEQDVVEPWGSGRLAPPSVEHRWRKRSAHDGWLGISRCSRMEFQGIESWNVHDREQNSTEKLWVICNFLPRVADVSRVCTIGREEIIRGTTGILAPTRRRHTKMQASAGASADFLHSQEFTLLYLESCGTVLCQSCKGLNGFTF